MAPTSHKPYDLNPFSSPVFSSFRPHLLLFLLHTLCCSSILLLFCGCFLLSFSTRKVFSGRLFYFFGKVDGWERGRNRRKEKKEKHTGRCGEKAPQKIKEKNKPQKTRKHTKPRRGKKKIMV